MLALKPLGTNLELDPIKSPGKANFIHVSDGAWEGISL